MWIFGQILWTDMDQNLTICTPLLTGQDAGMGTALSATHEAVLHHCCCHCVSLNREVVEWAKYRKNKKAGI